MKTNLVLYGFMGAGKSDVGRRLAQSHGLIFMDTDAIIEEQEGATIAEIFQARGEITFRGLEREVVRLLARRDGQVIATGGGVPLDAINVTELETRGVGIYLRAGARTLARRLEGCRGRPLLSGAPDLATIETLLGQRRVAYGRISHVIDTDRMTPEQVCQKAWQIYEDVRDTGGRRRVRV